MEVGCNFTLIAGPKVVFRCKINFRQLVDMVFQFLIKKFSFWCDPPYQKGIYMCVLLFLEF